MSRFIFIAAACVFAIGGCRAVAGLGDLVFEGDGHGGTEGGASGGAAGTGGGGTASASSAGGGTGGAGGGAGGQGSGGGAGGADAGAPQLVDCGEALTCEIGVEKACCWRDYADPESGECVQGPPDNDNCTSGENGRQTRIECQLPEHCPVGTVCCGVRESLNNNPWYASTMCQADCPFPDIVLCDLDGEQAPDCPVVISGGQPVQTICKPSQLLPPGYLVCGPP
jgi:hypothetical protein